MFYDDVHLNNKLGTKKLVTNVKYQLGLNGRNLESLPRNRRVFARIPNGPQREQYYNERRRRNYYNNQPLLACKQAHIWEHTRERQRANSRAKRSFGRSLVTRREESEPALISVKFHFCFAWAKWNTIGRKAGKVTKLSIYYVSREAIRSPGSR